MANAPTFDDDTIVGVSLEHPHEMRSLFLELPDAPGLHEHALDHKSFKIRLADSHGQRSSASLLIDKMYSWRGYASPASLHENPNRITLVASDNSPAGLTIGTLTLGLDSKIGLLVDEMYQQEIDTLREQGCLVCELTKLAVDQTAASKKVLASLFHISYIYGRILNHVSDVFIEVNPRHVVFYKRMLGFNQAGEEKTCVRVNAPAVLLRLELDHVDRQIEKFGGKLEQFPGEKSLYPYFFSKKEEEGLTKRILDIR